MPWFRCFIRGENFPLELDGKRQATGFYTTRYVEAADEGDAELKAVNVLRDDPALKVPPGTPGVEHAMVYVEEIELVDGPSAPNAGFTFFVEGT